MKTAIIYISKHGTTAKVAELIAEKLKDTERVILISLKSKNQINLSEYNKVILGTPIYAGKPLKQMMKFCEENENILKGKILGLFICGMVPTEENKWVELKNAYPKSLQDNAKAMGIMGGEFLLNKMTIFERMIIKKIAKIKTSVSNIDLTAIEIFSKQMI